MSHPDLFRICKEITIELQQLPGARFFNEPVRQDRADAPSSHKKTKRQDLSTILERLERGEYTEVKNWERDIGKVWENAEQYYGNKILPRILAQQMQKHFEKLKVRLEKRKISGWIKHLDKTRKKLDRLLLSPPTGVGPIFPIGKITSADDYARFSSRELDCLVDAGRYFVKEEELAQIAQLLQGESQMEGNPEELIVNVDELTPKTQHRLRDYFKKKLGQDYPT